MSVDFSAEQTVKGPATGLYSHNTDRIQAAFDAQHSRYLIYRGRQGKRLLYHFTRMVAANPESLRLHVKRIYLSVACYDSDAVLAAFADLLIVLSGRGETLCERLLEQAAPVIGEADCKLIMQARETTNLAPLLDKCVEQSVLHRGDFPRQLIL